MYLRWWLRLLLSLMSGLALSGEPVMSGPTRRVPGDFPIGKGVSGSSGCTYNYLGGDVVITAAHCLSPSGAAPATVRLLDGRELAVDCIGHPGYGGPGLSTAKDFALCAVRRGAGGAGPKMCFSSREPVKDQKIEAHGCARECNGGLTQVVEAREGVIYATRNERLNATPNGGDSGGLVTFEGKVVSVVSSSIRFPSGLELDTYPSVSALKPWIDQTARRLGISVCWDEAGSAPSPSPRAPEGEGKGGDGGKAPETSPAPLPFQNELTLELRLRLRIAKDESGYRLIPAESALWRELSRFGDQPQRRREEPGH